MKRRHVIRAAAATPIAALTLIVAGCGGGGAPSGVATIAGSTTTPAQSSAGPGSSSSGPSTSGSSGGSGEATGIVMDVGTGATGEQFTACMRKGGVPNFPDPNGQGLIQIKSGSGIDQSSPKFQAALTQCQKLLPNGGRPTQQQQQQFERKALAFSACMRAHGVKDFPDPSFAGGKSTFGSKGGPGSDLNPNSPLFQRAQKTCQGNLPGTVNISGPSSAGGK